MRQFGLGGSDIGAALGFCQYRTPLDVYLEKVGEAGPKEESYRMFWGTHQEPFILKVLEERPDFFVPETFKPTTLRTDFGTMVHPTEPWVLATPDGKALVDSKRHVLLECKTASVKKAEGWGDAGSSDVPAKFIAQGLWTAMVMRACGYPIEEIWVLALFGNREPQRFVIPWDEGRAEWLLEQGRLFWNNHVLKLNPPVALKEAA